MTHIQYVTHHRPLRTCIVLALIACATLGWTEKPADPQASPQPPAMSMEQAITAIQSPDPAVLRQGAIALIQWQAASKQAVPTMIQVLDNQPLDGPADLLFVLSELRSDAAPAVLVLIKYTESPNFHARYLACRSLGWTGESARPAVATLLKMLDDEVASVRRNAAEALGRLGASLAPEAVVPLIKATGDQSFPVREAAVLALGNFGERGQPAIEPLRQLLQEKRGTLRAAAAQSLWQLTHDTQSVLPVLQELLRSEDLPWEAAQALAVMGPAARPAVADLVVALDQDESTRLFAAEALGSIGPEASAALPALRKLLDHEEPEVRATAQAAIDKIQP